MNAGKIIGGIVTLTVLVFLPFFLNGQIPVPGAYMVSWYEPWKTDTTVGGVPTVPHKPIGDDVFRQVIPFKFLAIEELARGSVPLWNPYNGSGQPLLATIHSAYLNPFSFLLLLGNIGQGWGWYVLFQMILTGLMMYWYASLLGLAVPGAVVATVTLLLSGFMTIRLEYGVYGYAMASLAALAAAAELIRKRYVSGFVVTTGATAFLLYTVQPQIFTYILLFACGYGLLRLRNQVRDFVLFVLFLALGIGLAAPQLLPMFELYRVSNVTTEASRFIFDRFLLPWAHVITLGIPNYFGNAATYNWWGRGDFVQTMLTVGLIPTFLATYICFRNRRPIVIFLGCVVLTTILLTLDWPFTRWFYALPLPVISTNIPSRMFIVTTFCMSILAGLGYVQFEKDPHRRSPLIRFGILLAILLAVTLYLWRMPAACPPVVVTCRSSTFRNTVLEIAIFSGFAFPAVLFRKKATLLLWVTTGLLVVGGLYNAQKNIPFSEPNHMMPEHPLLSFLSGLAPDRIAGVGVAAFATDFASHYRYFDSNYYDPLYIRRYGELVSYVNTGSRTQGLTRSDINIVSDATVSAELDFRRSRFWDLAGTVALVTKKSDAAGCRPTDPLDSRGCDTLWQDKSWQVYRRGTVLPRAYLVSSVRVEPDPETALAELFSPETDIARSAIVEVPIPGLSVSDDLRRVATGSVVLDEYQANRLTLTVVTKSPSFLVLSDTFYPGWNAYVDGVQTDVYRTNYTFRGVVVQEGKHEVKFMYEPESFRYGLVISGISLMVWVAYVLRLRFKK